MLLLLHGLSANGGIWAEFEAFLAQEWDGRWWLPIFRGTGPHPRLPTVYGD